ncbi:hypothetical protein CC86DRAFT_36620 [Ophiobolus disseminans]|uniref:Heterokaryon incompatibility domain-containing protein n=1 Tax=Ophiobolus disseminans TaxID=1469910 RepID=A0A6A6ZY36_9PLEO|nr:hypothetical protein CC86DRAFT_36620 [Ophiobolus disseminans]
MMHRLYNESHFTIAILSKTLRTIEPLLALANLFSDKPKWLSVPLYGLDEATDALKFVASDTWFTRMWTMHEQFCTHVEGLRLLVAVQPGLSIPKYVATSVIGENLCLHPHDLHPRGFLRVQARHRETQERWERYFTHMKQAMNLQELPTIKFKRTIFWNTLLSTQDFENSVVAGRLLIIENIYKCPWRLSSTRLDNETYGYSTSVLALIMANRYQDRQDRCDKIKDMLLKLTLTGTLKDDDTVRLLFGLDELRNLRDAQIREKMRQLELEWSTSSPSKKGT